MAWVIEVVLAEHTSILGLFKKLRNGILQQALGLDLKHEVEDLLTLDMSLKTEV